MKIYKKDTRAYIVSMIVVIWFLLSVFCLHVFGSKEEINKISRAVPAQEMPIIFTLIAEGTRNNYQRIKAWSSDVNIKLRILHTGDRVNYIFKNITANKGEIPENIMQVSEEQISFVVDVNNNYVYIDAIRKEESNFFNPVSGANLDHKSGPYRSGPYWSTIICKPDYSFEVKTISFTEDNKISRRKVTKKSSKKEAATDLYDNIDDPRKVFAQGWIFIWDHFDMLSKRIKKFGGIEFDGYSLKMEELKEGETIVYKVIEPSIVSMERKKPTDYLLITKLFSSQYGFNMIRWEASAGNGVPLQEVRIEYELVGDCYLPKKVLEKHYGLDGNIHYEKESTYTNNKVNQAICPEIFKYTNLALKDGEILKDEIENKEYLYMEDQKIFVPIEKR